MRTLFDNRLTSLDSAPVKQSNASAGGLCLAVCKPGAPEGLGVRLHLREDTSDHNKLGMDRECAACGSEVRRHVGAQLPNQVDLCARR